MATVAVYALATMQASDWSPFGLFVLLCGGTVISSLFPITVRDLDITGTSIGMMLAAALLGPAPALAIALVTTGVLALQMRHPPSTMLCNAAALGTFSVMAAVFMLGFRDLGWTDDDVAFGACVAVAFLVANVANFVLLAIDLSITRGHSIRKDVNEIYWPMLPTEFSAAALTGSLAAVYLDLGMGVGALIIVVCIIFQYQHYSGSVAIKRGEQLEQRTNELASLQVGLLSTVMKTLSLRDKMTARHSAAVARYSREMARAHGLTVEEQDLVHTAALLHDIGKFVFPDSILFADTSLTDKQYAIVKTHPQRGAELVASIEGYGPVAEVILAHHERIDGRGYPNGVSGNSIPVASRIIAIADTYDVMTARDSYRRPVSSELAIAELRRVAGAQLDGELVEVFVELVESGRLAFRHSDDHDFERELQSERRVQDYAQPKVAA